MANTLPQHVPALDGLRAVAALGVLVTHVSFQTATGWAWAERLDYFVAVFFALSAFVLWRRRDAHSPAGYYLARFRRVMPAYWACVAVVFLALPGASFSAVQVLSTLTATQIYVPDGLASGVTQLWSLCVEFAFYLVLPWLPSFRSLRARLIALGSAAALSLGWAWVAAPIEDFTGVNAQIWPPAYAAWFAVGMAAAELEGRVRAPRRAWPFWVLAAGCVWLGSREWFGPQGLTHPTPGEFARRVAVGAVFAAAIVVPYALGTRSPVLESPLMRRLGLWSYAIFLWHVAVLWIVFPLTGLPLFSGYFFLVLIATAALTIPIAAASYYWVEVPASAWLAANAPRLAPAKAASSQKSPA